MTSLCDYMLETVGRKLKANQLRTPVLRRQIACSWGNPYDMEHVGNLDLKLFVEDFVQHHGNKPSDDQLESLAIFPTTENLVMVQKYLKNLSSFDTNLSKL